MEASSLFRVMPLVQRALYATNGHLDIRVVFVALALCLTTVAYARGSESTHSIQVAPGWNLLSLPASVSNGSRAYLFPSAVSPAYVFQHPAGYVSQDTLHNGTGFWLKFNSSDTVQITGNTVFSDTVEVQAGWNIIGGVSMPVPVIAIITQPTGILSSNFFGYTPGLGYQVADTSDTLYPGQGYWVKVSQAGSLIFSWKGVVLNDSTKQPETLPNFTSVTVDSNQLILTYVNGGDLPSLSPGDFLVGNSGGGYARRVLSATPNGNQLIVSTEGVSLDEVIDHARVDTTYPIEFPDLEQLNRLLGQPLRSQGYHDGKFCSISASTPLIDLSPDARLLTLRFPNFNLEIGNDSTIASVSVSADTLTFALEANIQSFVVEYDFGLRACRIVVQLIPSIRFAGMQILLTATLDTTYERPLIPVPLPLPPIPTPIPGLILTPEFNFIAGLTPSFSASGGVETNGIVEIGGTLDAGFDYIGGIFVPVWNTSIFGSVESAFEPSGSVEGEVIVFLKPTLDFRVWGTLGVGLFEKVYEYNQIGYPPLAAEIGVGVAGGVSASMKIFDQYLFKTDLTLLDYRWTLFTAHGPNEPSNPSPASGLMGVSTSPTLSWICSDPDGDPLTYDAYFGTSNPPDTIVSSGQSGTSLPRSGLSGGTTYHWKVVAKDNHSNSTSGPVWSFTTTGGGSGSPCPGTPTVTYAGKTYNTVQIESQCWLRENLDVGTRIDGMQVQTNNGIIEKYCYDNNPANCNTYGGLYQWDEAMQYVTTEGAQGICPLGWHIPTMAELQTLSATVGGDGNALKRADQGSGAGQGTNTSGFSALLAGFSQNNGTFYALTALGFFRSCTQAIAPSVESVFLLDYDALIHLNIDDRTHGFSVRCLRD